MELRENAYWNQEKWQQFTFKCWQQSNSNRIIIWIHHKDNLIHLINSHWIWKCSTNMINYPKNIQIIGGNKNAKLRMVYNPETKRVRFTRTSDFWRQNNLLFNEIQGLSWEINLKSRFEYVMKDLSHFEHPLQFQIIMMITICTSVILVFTAKISILQIHLCGSCGVCLRRSNLRKI